MRGRLGREERVPVTINRMDNVLIVVDDLETVKAFFIELGLTLEGETTVEGPLVGHLIGLKDVRATLAMLRPPDGHGGIELDKFHTPHPVRFGPVNAPVNALGLRRVMFAVDDIDEVVARMRRHGSELIGEMEYGDAVRLAYIRGPEGLIVGLAEERRRAAKRTRRSPPMTNAETQIESYFAKYKPARATFGRALRAKLRARLPGLFEIVYVYENQDALVISYSPSENGYEGLCSMALYPDKVTLNFGQGALLSKSDPNKLLQGSGKTVRHVALDAVEDLDRPEIEALMAAALKLAKVRLVAGAKGPVILKAEAQKQRARRATK
jgi:catechol 2,3-dioxygenase-like lactoylglutathione lyase family enzyme